MKKIFLKAFATTLAVIGTFAITANADFAKTKNYADGTFTDVPASEWYAQSVKDAYEFGIMNGNSETTFNPEGTLTVAEGVTVAARIGETVTGKAIPEVTGGEWYTKYVNYCISEGVFAEDKFNDYDRNITRGEMAELFAAVSGDMPKINSVTDLPDVPKDAEFYGAVIKLYNSGILTGNDSFGTFAPFSELKRSEISAMAVRIADGSKRVAKTFEASPVRAYYDAYAVIEAAVGTGSTNGIANGWNYDYRFNLLNYEGKDFTYISDSSDEKFGSLKRDFDPEYAGILVLELYSEMKSQNGCVYYVFQNENLENVVSLEEKGGKFALVGTETVISDIDVPAITNSLTAIRIELDLDKNTASAVVNNRLVGTVAIADSAVSRFEMGCRKIGTGYVALNQVYLNKNYPLYDRFFATDANIGEKPVLWDVTGDFAYGSTVSTYGTDKYSIKAEAAAGSVSTASKTFDAVSGKVLFETNILLPEKIDGASVSLTSEGVEAVKIESRNGKLVIGDTVLHDYTPNVWQSLYVVADTNTATALIKINGKERATVPFYAKDFDGVKIGFAPNADGVMWFDDVNVSNIIDHPDYPSYPKVAESKDYNIGINSCYLWRDSQSREGWDSVSTFSEFDTYMGFYDEGLVESADWELKWMAEHGIDFIHLCWYAPNYEVTAPIKEMKTSHSVLHDGYMNAKYSNLVDFCIMWECGFQGVTNAEQFKSYLWPYWKEYYFSDDRYLRLDNKAILTVFNKSKFESMLGGQSGANEVMNFMDAELKKMGYDGLILWFTTQDVKDISGFENIDKYDVETASYAYHWHKMGYSASYQTDSNRDFSDYASTSSSHHVPTVSVGFNDVGRNESRSALITGEDHKAVCEDIKNQLSGMNTGTWRDNTLMVSTWNEYSEGTYVLPTNSHGFAYLENIRQVFTDDTSDHSALDVKLNTSQLNRVGHLYPPNHSPIRWLQLEALSEQDDGNTVSTNPDELDVIKAFDLASEMKVSHNVGVQKQEAASFAGTAQATDFAIVTAKDNSFFAKQCPVLHIRMKVSEGGKGEIFFLTDIDTTWNAAKSKTFELKNPGEFADYYINMSECALWNSYITKIRIDPNDRKCDFEVTSFEILGDSSYVPAKKANIVINGFEMKFTFPPVFTDDGDIEVAAEERNMGFFSMLGLYHEYDRFTDGGVLKVYTRDEKTLIFKAGSDKVLVNGNEEDLGYTFTFRDGLPVFKLKKLLSYTGFEYTISGDTVTIKAANDEDYANLVDKRDDAFEFNIDGDLSGFTSQHTIISQGSGRLIGTRPTDLLDPAVMVNVSLDTNKYSECVVGMLYTDALIEPRVKPQLFFTQTTSFSGEMMVNGTYDLTGKKEGDIVEIHFDLRSNPAYFGTISRIRFDPHQVDEGFEIDYIRFIKGDISESIVKNYEPAMSLDISQFKGYHYTVISQTSDKFEGKSNTNDPHFPGIPFEPFAANDYQVLHIRMKSDKEGKAQLFFGTDSDGTINEKKSCKINIEATEEIADYYVMLASSSEWSGTIVTMRFDPIDVPDATFVIEKIEFMKKK